jgi:hypothetical protein
MPTIDENLDETPIPAGKAQAALLAATANLASAEAHATRALETFIATSHAIARALDATDGSST